MPEAEVNFTLTETDLTKVKKAAAMLSDPKITKKEVAQHFGVSRTTLNASLAKSTAKGKS